MPRLSDTMEEGTIGRWLVKEGDAVHEGDVVAEIETDKATMEYQAYADGTVLRILVPDGGTAPLGAPIAIIGEPGEQTEQLPAVEGTDSEPAPTPPPAQAQAPPREQPAAAAPTAPAASGNGSGGGYAAGLRVSPIARRMADQAGIDLAGLAGRGSGPDGRVVKADVERLIAGGGQPQAAAEWAPQAPAPAAAAAPVAADELRDLSPMLKAVARRMSESKASVPHFYVSSDIDMTGAMQMRAELNEALADSGEKISLNDLIVRASGIALIRHPQAHRSYVDGKHAYHAHANIGIAVALDDGLIVPVLRCADAKPLRAIAQEARDLARRARDGKLKQPEIEGGTFTVSNLGMLDVSAFSAIINPPESAILAVGATVERPVVRDGRVVVRSIMTVTLACDHRACSGADGARLLQTIRGLLEAPSTLLLD
jgi:pyruvate dehydrogenase E2 component (dihydrolipoyllysine-residue acetyltransferase)